MSKPERLEDTAYEYSDGTVEIAGERYVPASDEEDAYIEAMSTDTVQELKERLEAAEIGIQERDRIIKRLRERIEELQTQGYAELIADREQLREALREEAESRRRAAERLREVGIEAARLREALREIQRTGYDPADIDALLDALGDTPDE